MKNKYEEKSLKLLKEHHSNCDGNICREYNQSDIIDAMCQLAEEVESKLTIILNEAELIKAKHDTDSLCKYQGDYIRFEWLKDMINLHKTTNVQIYTKEQVEELLQKQRELCAEEVDLKHNAIGILSDIDKNSILNAKLKLE